MRRAAQLATPIALGLALSCRHAPPTESDPWPRGFTAVEGSAADASTGLPHRIRHGVTGMVLVLIPAGRFAKGSIAEPFYIGVTEVTTGQFRRFVEATGYRTDAERGVPEGNGRGRGSFTALPGGGREWSDDAQWRSGFAHFPEFRLTDDVPAMQTSWNDAQAFAARFGMRLPSEIEWEYAARASCDTLYPWGDSPTGGAAFANVRDRTAASHFGQPEVVFPFDDRSLLVAPVATYEPNAWGLYDTVGNLAEWVDDAWDDSRVVRGGGWCDYPEGASLESRAEMPQGARRDFIGFRVAMSPK